MANKISDFFCVGTSGPTVDGRELREQWLQDCGKTYSRNEYQGFIWYEHYRFPGNFGQVIETKVEKKEDGRYKIYNRLQPSDRLLELHRAGQKIHSSLEIVPNFAQSGMAYQVGLAVTDSPASLGTDQLKLFSDLEKRLGNDQEYTEFCNGVLCERIDKYKTRIPDEAAFKGKEVEIYIGEQWPDLEFTTEKTVFDFGAKLLGGLGFKSPPNSQEQEETEMNLQEFEAAFTKGMKPFNDKFDSLDGRLKNLEDSQQNHSSGEGAAGSESNQSNASTTEGGSSTGDEHNYASQESVTELNGKMDKVIEALSKIPSGDGERSESTNGGEVGSEDFTSEKVW